jgi:oxygen-independent coproporphyrinogen-3 oxidase
MQPFTEKFSRRGVGIYVHFPWCLEKCPYCDFLSVKVPGAEANLARARRIIPHERYAEAILTEAEERLRWLKCDDEAAGRGSVGGDDAAGRSPRAENLRGKRGGNWEVDTIFFGGGTPSLWAPTSVERVLLGLEQLFPLSSAPEITIECNPTSVDLAHFRALRGAGVNRVSVGVQATDNQRLGFLGRLHDEAGGPRALREATEAGFSRISGDLIFGVHRQPPEAALADVTRVLAAGVNHLSCYALTIEQNTRFGALHRAGQLPLLEDELVARSFEAISDELSSRGFEHYEISNYALPGQRSRHNLGYWLGNDYLGLGTGAYGTVHIQGERVRYRNYLSPERYMAAFERGSPDAVDPFSEKVSEREVLEPETSLAEAIMLGLRLAEGICPDELEEACKARFWTKERTGEVERLLRREQLACVGTRLLIPPSQWLLADGIIARLL